METFGCYKLHWYYAGKKLHYGMVFTICGIMAKEDGTLISACSTSEILDINIDEYNTMHIKCVGNEVDVSILEETNTDIVRFADLIKYWDVKDSDYVLDIYVPSCHGCSTLHKFEHTIEDISAFVQRVIESKKEDIVTKSIPARFYLDIGSTDIIVECVRRDCKIAKINISIHMTKEEAELVGSIDDLYNFIWPSSGNTKSARMT